MLMPAASASPLPSTSPAALNAALTANGVITNGLPTVGATVAETAATTTNATSPTTATATVPTVLPAVTTATTASAMVNHTTQKDTTWTKLFVGGLPYHTTDKSLREHFEVYGDIEEAVVITDRQTGKSRGYGFVIMATKESAERACKEPNPIIDGRKANVNLAILGAKPRLNSLQVGLPLTALRQSFHALLPAAAAATGQIGIAPAAAAPSNPYLQQMYAAAAAAQNPYALQGTGLISLAQNPMTGAPAAASTGNPLLDAYGQYAALAAATGVYTTSASATGSSFTSPLDTAQAANGMSGYLTAGGYYAPAAMAGMQAAGMTGATATPGLAAYAAAAPPTVSSQATAAADGRIQ